MGSKGKGINRIKKIEMVFIFCLLVGLLVIYFWGKAPSLPEPEFDFRADLEVSGNFFLSRLEKNQPQLQVEGRDYLLDKERGKASFFSPRVHIHTSSGLVSIESAQAEYQSSPELLVFSGGVEIRFSDYLIESEQLEYHPKDSLLKIPGPLKVQGAGMELKGKGAWFDLRSSRMGIDSQVKGKFEKRG